MFWLRNKKNNFQLHTLIWGPGNMKIMHILLFFEYDQNKLFAMAMEIVINL